MHRKRISCSDPCVSWCCSFDYYLRRIVANGFFEQRTVSTYQLIIASYDKLPDQYKSQIDSKRVEDQAVLKFFNQPDKHVLVATSKDEDLLVRAGRYLANYELMTQTDKEDNS